MRSLFLMMICCCAAVLAAQDKPPLLGRVVDEQGKPLANVAVCMFAAGQRWTTAELVQAAGVHTDRLGRFQLEDASATRPPHWDSVLLVAPGRLSMVVGRRHIDFAPIVLPPGAVLAGRVLDPSGNPIAGARVQASDYLREVVYLETEPGDRQLEPAPVAAARTDARGAFVLTGACGAAAWLVADGDGLREAMLGPVSAHDPLSIVLVKAPMLRGRVVDPENGAVGDLQVQMVGRDGESRWTRTDDAGAFAFTWPGGPVRLSVAVPRGEQRGIASANVEDPGAETVLTLRMWPLRKPLPVRRQNKPRKVEPERVVSVRAIGPDGQPSTEFRASVHRINRQQQDYRTEVQQLREFEAASAKAIDGVAAATVFDGHGKDGLLVLVQAPDMALFCEVFDVDSESVEVKLEPAGVIAGKVVDARSGEPLAGARVWSLAKSERFQAQRLLFNRVPSDPEFGVVTTDAAGAFRLERVAAGTRHLFCALPGRAERPPELVEIASGGSRLDLRLELAPLLDLDGHLAGELSPRTLGVRLKKHTPGSWTSTEATDYSSIFAVDAQGRFRATGIAPGKYEAQLVVVRPPRRGMPDKLLLDVVDVGLETKTLELDATPTQPARITGRITGSVPASRLAVVSSAAPTGNNFFGFLHYEGPVAPVEPDGSFALEEPPGARILVVIDVWTGAMLHREPEVQVARGSERKVDLTIDAVAVEFRVTGASVGWHWLEIAPAPEHWPGGVGQIAAFDDHGYFLHMGARLEPGRTEGVLYLPAAPCELRLRAAGGRTRKPNNKDVLARQAVDPSQPGERNVTIALPPK